MVLVSSGGIAQTTLGLLATWTGQLALALLSVVFLVLAKNLSRQPGNGTRALHSDDLAIGFDLLVLAMITSIGYAVSQYRAAQGAASQNDDKALNLAQQHEQDALMFSIFVTLSLLTVTWLTFRLGQLSDAERETWKAKKLAKLQEDKPEATALDLKNEPPRFKVLCGLIIPGLFGLFMLVVAIKSAAV